MKMSRYYALAARTYAGTFFAAIAAESAYMYLVLDRPEKATGFVKAVYFFLASAILI